MRSQALGVSCPVQNMRTAMVDKPMQCDLGQVQADKATDCCQGCATNYQCHSKVLRKTLQLAQHLSHEEPQPT